MSPQPYLHDKVVVGDVLEVGVPCGDSLSLQKEAKALSYLSAGFGITPLLGMMKVSANKIKRTH